MNHNKLWTILKKIGIPDHLAYILRNVSAGQEARVRIGHGTVDWFRIVNRVHQGLIATLLVMYLQNAHHVKCWAG